MMTDLYRIGIMHLRRDLSTSLHIIKVIYHPLYSMINFVTNKSKLPQNGHKCFLIWGDWLSCDPLRESHDSQSPPYMG